jgi:hypothetical protein
MRMSSVTLTGTIKAGDVLAALAGLPLTRSFVRPVRLGPIRLPESATVAEVVGLLSDLADDTGVEVDLSVDIAGIVAASYSSEPRRAMVTDLATLAMGLGLVGDSRSAEPYFRALEPLAAMMLATTPTSLEAARDEAHERVNELHTRALERIGMIGIGPAPALALVPDAPEPTPRESFGFVGRMPAGPSDEPPHSCVDPDHCCLSARECWTAGLALRARGDEPPAA